MEIVCGIVCLITSLALIAMCFVQSQRDEVPLASTRNFFLGGFVIFVSGSGAFALLADWTEGIDLFVEDESSSGLQYTLMMLLFLGIFFFFYKKSGFMMRVADRVRSNFSDTGPYSMLVLAFVTLLLGIFLRFAFIYVPIVGILALILASGVCAAAAALAVWAWAPRLLNPLVALPAFGIVVTSIGISLTNQFGRRDLLTVLLACLFAAYHSHWKYLSKRKAIMQVMPLGLGAIIVLSAVSGGRTEEANKQSVFDRLSSFNVTNVMRGSLLLLGGPETANNSMWLIEHRPEPTPFNPLHSLVYAVTQPIPRATWAGKPNPLGFTMVSEAGILNRSAEFNYGPGLIGHIENDLPYVALPLYAAFLALAFLFCDRIIKVNPTNPFMIIPFAAGVGDLFGFARGEFGLFLFRATAMMVFVWFALVLLGKLTVILGVGRANSNSADQSWDDAPISDGYGEYAGYDENTR